MAKMKHKKDDSQWLIIGLVAFVAFMLIRALPMLSNLNTQATSINQNAVLPVSNILGFFNNIVTGISGLFKSSPTINQASPSFFNSINQSQPYPSSIIDTMNLQGNGLGGNTYA